MGSKVIILLGLLASALYLYFFMNKQNILVQQEEMPNNIIENKIEENIEPIISEVESTNSTEEIVKKNEEEIEIINERVATPAFGFMAGAKKNQIVALMSDHDENGTLAKYIDDLCQKSECSKDLRFENDIIDALWQDGVSKIIEIMVDGGIENGSLFIEGEVLKLEGTITSNEVENKLNSILDSVKSDKFKIENHSKLSNNIVQKDENKTSTIKHIVKNDNKQKEQNITKIIDKNSSAEKAIDKTEIEKPQIKSKVKNLNKKEIKQKTAKRSKVTKKPKTKKTVHKHTIKRVKNSEPEILPEPVMITSIDLEEELTAEHSIKENVPTEGIVAKPYMQTTSQTDDLTVKKIKKSRSSKKDIVAPGKLEILSEKYNEAQREIRDLLIANPIQFESKSSVIDKKSRDTLDKVVQIVNELDNCDVVIEGYIDSDVNSVYNKVLSQKRADMVKRYLKNKNMKYKTVKSIGYGSDTANINSSSEPSEGTIEILFISGETK